MIIRVHKRKNYAVLDQAMLRDKRLSFGARGLLGYLLSKPHDWQVTMGDLINQSPAGRDAVYSLCKELKKFKYMQRVRKKDVSGKFVWETVVSEAPMDDENPLPEKPEVEASPSPDLPYMDNPEAGKPDTVKPDLEKAAIYVGSIDERSTQVLRSEDLARERTLFDDLELLNNEPVEPPARPQTIAEQVTEIFEYWKARLDHPTAKLLAGSKRDKAVRARIKDGYTVLNIKLAIVGCRCSPHNIGLNDRHRRFDDLELICRTSEQLEGFMQLAFDNGFSESYFDEQPSPEQAAELWRNLPTFNPDEPQTYDGLFGDLLMKIKGRVSEEAFNTWFAVLRCVEVTDDHFTIYAPNQVVKDWIIHQYGKLLVEFIPGRSICWQLGQAPIPSPTKGNPQSCQPPSETSKAIH